MISISLFLTWNLALSVHGHIAQAFDLPAMIRMLAERAMSFCILFVQVSVSKVFLSLKSITS